MPESPRWLAARGRAKDAELSLLRLGGHPAPGVAEGPAGPISVRPPVTALLAPNLRGRTSVVALLWFLSSLVSFGLVTWVPSIYVSVFDIPVAQSLRYNAIASIFIFIIPLVLRRPSIASGRRLPAILGTATGGLSLLGLTLVGAGQVQLLVTLTIIGQIGVSIGSMVLWPYTAEVYETRVRAVALGAASSLARGASMLTPLVVGGLLAVTGTIAPVFLIFGLSAVTVALLWWRATQETAGREIDS